MNIGFDVTLYCGNENCRNDPIYENDVFLEDTSFEEVVEELKKDALKDGWLTYEDELFCCQKCKDAFLKDNEE